MTLPAAAASHPPVGGQQLRLRLVVPRVSADELLGRLLEAEGIDLSTVPTGGSVARLGEALDVVIREVRMRADGQLLYDRRRPRILLREGQGPLRQRFTLAHELAHLLIYRAAAARCLPACLRLDPAGRDLALLEWHVERLASAILLPRSRFRSELADLATRPLSAFGLARALGDRFGASLTAACRRLAGLDQRYIALAASWRALPFKPSALRIDWSECLRRDIAFIPRHKSLDARGPAFDAIARRRLVRGPVRLQTTHRSYLVAPAEAVAAGTDRALMIVDLRHVEDRAADSEGVPRLLTERRSAPSTFARSTDPDRADGATPNGCDR